ncbi:HNH endonuclease [Clostridium magnum]|uniref:HNH domain-containing protein n=1 Tax=Clostridium magnum DSM 2767 TaxID=1121326 RepID=A0A162UWC8_9CLOT|nr:HNH endonuclease [Clostridium magnum]KZL94357.1 hypothetical protein CLMAG_14100 [Clostridium magnum DSM 2767]SHJ52219.1 HNH endonuclease [Clostridium magnum DSM 2767]
MAKEFAKKFYKSKTWKSCRDSYFIHRYGLCERCSKPGKIVHHKEKLTPANINNPKVSLNWDKLELLCQDCHNKEHMSNGVTQYGLMFDSEGNLIKQ